MVMVLFFSLREAHEVGEIIVESSIFKNWTKKQTTDFLNGFMIAEHALPDMEIFSEHALEELLETHPDELSMVYAMPKKATGNDSFREGDLRGSKGKDIIEAVSKGHLWVQLLKLNSANPAFKKLEKQIISEFKNNVPGLKIFGCRMSLLISSPDIHVSYHADIPRNALWQIRGSKKIYIYPVEDQFISEQDLEGVYLGETQEAIKYEKEFDQHASIVDLKPGMMVTWPINGPHRIVNDDNLSVSLAMEYFEPVAWFRYAVFYTNGVMRRRFGLPMKSKKTSGPRMWIKTITSTVFKVLRIQKKHQHARYLTFKIDPSSSTGFSEIPKQLRSF